jgi:Family of unknown function (DUF6941)
MSDTCTFFCMTEQQVTDFEVIAFFPADHASVVEGKLYVNGGIWDRLNFPAYPQAIPLVSLVAVVRVPYRAYHQDHTFGMRLENAENEPLSFRVEGGFRFGTEPHMRVGDPSLLSMAVPVAGVVLEGPGDYSFVFSIDGTDLVRYPLRAVQVVGAPQLLTPPADPSKEGPSGDDG